MSGAIPTAGHRSRTDAVLALRAEGLSNRIIGECLGISCSAVSGLLSSAARTRPGLAGLNRNPRKVSDEDSQRIGELRERGWSYARIAGKFGISTGAVHYHCLKQGAFTPRSPGKRGAKGPQDFVARDGRRQRRFTDAEDAEIQRLSMEGVPTHRIAEHVGRAVTSIRIRLMTLALHDEMGA